MSAADALAVSVTDHALRRWRERCAEYADAKVHDLVAAFRQSLERPPAELPPGLYHRPGFRYFAHAPTGSWFVVDGRVRGVAKVVSVVVPGVRNPLTPKTKRKKGKSAQEGLP